MLLFSAKLEITNVISIGSGKYIINAYFIDNSGVFSVGSIKASDIIYQDLSLLGLGASRYKIIIIDPTYVSSGTDFKCTIVSDNPNLEDYEPIAGLYAIIGQNDGFGTTAITDITRNEVSEVFVSSVRNVESYYSSKRIVNELEVIAATPIGGHRIVTSDGYYASHLNPLHIHKIFGLSVNAVSAGEKVRVRYDGSIYESSWNWDLTKPIYLGMDGTLIQTPPTIGFIKVIANVISINTILLQLQNKAIILGD